MNWYNPQSEPFKLSGFPFYEKEWVYRRLPMSQALGIPDAVYGLADETAGGQIRFHAKFKELSLQVSRMAKPGFFDHVKSPHLAEVTRGAFDLYLSKDGKDFIFYDVSKNMTNDPKHYVRKLVSLEEPEEFDVLLNFPLYGGIDKVLIGLDDEAEVSAPWHRFKDDKKLVIYGSSIQQGACASRPGMGMSNLLSRWLNREVYNLGFSSSGKAEPEMAHIIADIPDTAALIISVEGNCPDSQWLDEKVRGFLEIYRQKKPTTPVILLPFIVSGLFALTPAKLRRRMTDRAIQQKIVEERRAAGDENIYCLLQEDDVEREMDGNSMWHEITVDGLHYSDLGFYWTTKPVYRFLKEKMGL